MSHARGRLGLLFAALAAASSAHAAPDKPSAASESSQVKPAQERSLAPTAIAKPVGTKGSSSESTSAGRPLVRGMRVPEALRMHLKAQMDARIDKDLSQIKGLRVEAVNLLTRFVNDSPREAAEMPEAMMRLGELRWELERESFVDRFKAWEGRPVDQRGAAPEPNFAPSRNLFGRVLRDYPWFTEYDLALYVDGFLASEQGKTDEALSRFERILKEYPSSRFLADAHMFKAETLLNFRYDYPGALASYEEVLKFKGSELYGLALFKSAWCLWRLGNTDEAAKRFVSVFVVTDTSSTGNKSASSQKRKQLDELQGEALKYLVEVLTEDEKNTASDAYNFLTKVGGDRFAGKVVKALAETFYNQSHYERGIEAYELLLKLDPTSPSAGDWVLQIAAGYFTIEDYAHLKATYERALAGYTTGGPWSRTQADPANVAETSKKIQEALKEHAVALHGKAQHDKTSRAEYEAAASLYDVYLSRFGKEADAYQLYYYLGEIEFYHLNKMTDAATHYVAAAREMSEAQAKEEPLKSMRHDALNNAVAALQSIRLRELETRKNKAGLEETETDKKLAETLDLYARLYPNAPELPEFLFRQGKLYYDYKVYDSAVKIFGTLVEKFPNSQFSTPAGELILDSFNRSNNYDNIETWARRLKSARGFESAAQQARLDTLIVQSVFRQGEQKGRANDHLGAAAAYLHAAKEFPRDARAAQACVNAELEAQKAGDLATLKEAAQLVTGKDYRDKPESPLGAWTAAATLQSMGLFGEAAEFDEAITDLNDRDHPHYQKYDHTKDAAYNAVVLRVATGDHDKAITDGNKFLRDFPNAVEADEVVFQMGKAHQNAGRSHEAAELYKRYLPRSKNMDHRVEGYVLLAMADAKSGDDKGADDALQDAVSIGKHQGKQLSPEGKYAAAHARYMEGERVLVRFDKIQIQGDVKQLTGRLKQKAGLLKEAAQVFLDTVSLGVAEWSTAALYRIGHTYESFARSMRDAPPPPNLSDADKEAYQAQIEEFVVPIEEKSLDAYDTGWKKALELGIYNQWTAKMREALGRLNAEIYPPFKEIGFDVRSAGTSPFPPLLEAPRRVKATDIVPTAPPAAKPTPPAAAKGAHT